jgi:hypothetical protein
MTDESVRYVSPSTIFVACYKGLITSMNPHPFFQSALDNDGIFSDPMLWILKHLSERFCDILVVLFVIFHKLLHSL